MRVISLFWWLARHRLTRRVLLWLVVRLIRRFGWQRTLRQLLGGRRRWRFLALVAWRAVVGALRVGRAALRLAAPRAQSPRGLGRSRTPLTRRLARRRDRIRRSLLAAAGVDPNWRPPSRRGIGATRPSGELTPPT